MILFTVSGYTLTKLAIILYNVFIYMSVANFIQHAWRKSNTFYVWFSQRNAQNLFGAYKCALRKIIWIYFRFSIWLLLSSSVCSCHRADWWWKTKRINLKKINPLLVLNSLEAHILGFKHFWLTVRINIYSGLIKGL